MKNRKASVMVVGKTGRGKTAINVDVVRTFLSERRRHDSQKLEKHQGCNVYVSSLPSLTVNKGAEKP